MLVLPVSFSMIPDDPISISNWGSLSISSSDFPVQSIVHPLEKTIFQIHISDLVDAFWESDASGHLPVSVSPVVLDALHVPLVYNYNDLFFGAFVDFSEQVVIFGVDKNSFEFWEEKVH